MEYVQAVLESFPEDAVANPDEARAVRLCAHELPASAQRLVTAADPLNVCACTLRRKALYSHGGYVILDIRNDAEVEKYGRIPSDPRGGYSVHVPYQFSRRWFQDGEVQTEVEPNPEFLDEVESMFERDARLLIMDFDGRSCAPDALEALYEAGFEEIVGLQGGYRNWFKTWDNKLKRRNLGEYQEHSWGEGETSCGIHASGAGFENQDAQSADFWNSF